MKNSMIETGDESVQELSVEKAAECMVEILESVKGFAAGDAIVALVVSTGEVLKATNAPPGIMRKFYEFSRVVSGVLGPKMLPSIEP